MALDWIVGIFALVGALFAAVAAFGIVRMPDVYTRMQSATKAGSLGVACVVIAAMLDFRDAIATVESVLVIAFLFGTAPVASILIGRAAHLIGIPMWKDSFRDDLRDSLRKDGAGFDDPAPPPDDTQ